MSKKWWIDHKDYDWDKVIFIDETAFKTEKKKMDRKKEKKHYIIKKVFKKSKLLGIYLQRRKFSLKLFTQNTDAEFYVKILKEKFNEIRSIGRKTGSCNLTMILSIKAS